MSGLDLRVWDKTDASGLWGMGVFVPDDLWAVIAPLLPCEPEKPKGGRPRASDRAALAGIMVTTVWNYAMSSIFTWRKRS